MGTMTEQPAETEIRRSVRDHYAKLATLGHDACCADTSCACSSSKVGIPQEAREVGAGCGSPILYMDLKEGEVVVDLGSGGGIDVFQAASFIGPTGRAIGIDSTPEMVWRARQTAEKNGIRNVEFRLGEIEHIPMEEGEVDWVISNCVINLAPSKAAVFRDAFRILKPGGSLVVSDIVSEEPISKKVRADLEGWAACLGGAIEKDRYLHEISEAGFRNAVVLESKEFPSEMTEELTRRNDGQELKLLSITVRAQKISGEVQ